MSDDTRPPTDTSAPRYGRIDRDYSIRLATTPPEEDGPVWMLNLMKYRQVADYTDGRDDRISGREADDRYTPIESLTAIGAEIVLVADVEQQLLGDEPTWDRVAVVKYPTRRSFIEMQQRPDFQAKHVHKDAGMEQTFVIGCRPMSTETLVGDREQPDWSDVPHPPTEDDGPIMVLHVLRFHDDVDAGVSPDDMDDDSRRAGDLAVPHGARVDGWFSVEGTIVGDGRAWHQARFNAFPSRAAFMAVVADPAWLEAQRAHRKAAIADTYTMILRPSINALRESIDA